MKFLVDAQLPLGVKKLLIRAGFDAIHTDDLPEKERTTDNTIRIIAEQDGRIVISKDADFVDSFHINRNPKRLLLISTGNIKNSLLYMLFSKNLNQIIVLFETCDLVEMSNTEIIGYQ